MQGRVGETSRRVNIAKRAADAQVVHHAAFLPRRHAAHTAGSLSYDLPAGVRSPKDRSIGTTGGASFALAADAGHFAQPPQPPACVRPRMSRQMRTARYSVANASTTPTPICCHRRLMAEVEVRAKRRGNRALAQLFYTPGISTPSVAGGESFRRRNLLAIQSAKGFASHKTTVST